MQDRIITFGDYQDCKAEQNEKLHLLLSTFHPYMQEI